MGRVKFDSASYCTCGQSLELAERIIQGYQSNVEINDVNKIIELYNIKKFFDNNLTLVSWSEDQISEYKKVSLNGRFSFEASQM